MTRSPDDILDELLVLRCQDGDAKALETLVGRWEHRLRRHAWRFTGQADAASDVVQEAWLAIVRGIRRLDDPACFRPWALRIVMHKCADWTRRRERQRRVMQNVADDTAGRTARPTDRKADTEEIDQLLQALRKLPSDRRMILSCSTWTGCPPGRSRRVWRSRSGR